MLNPPSRRSVNLRFGQLQTLGGLATEAPSSLSVYEYDSPLPASTQWNAGVQIALPWATALDVGYVGQHGYNIVEGINLNGVDFGTAYLPQYQDRTLAPTTPGATSVPSDQMRAFRGFSGITQNVSRGWITHHSLQLSINRRFSNGLSYGFNDTIGLSSRGSTAARLQHNPDGSVTYRSDQAQADDLLQTPPIRHTMKGNFVWDLPDVRASGAAWRTVGLIVNDWQLSGIWTASTAGVYTVGYSYQNGGGNVNITGIAGLRRPDQHRWRHRRRMFERSVSAVQYGGIPGGGRRQSRPRIRRRLSARVLRPDHGPVDRPQYPAGRGPQHSAPGRHVQRVEPRRHHRP